MSIRQVERNKTRCRLTFLVNYVIMRHHEGSDTERDNGHYLAKRNG